VVGGRIVAGRLVRLACERHLTDLKVGAKRGLVWDGAAARHAIDFFGHLRHSTGEWARICVCSRPPSAPRAADLGSGLRSRREHIR